MSSEFQPISLSYDSNISTCFFCIFNFSVLKVNIATCRRRLYSTILAEFSWYSESMVLKPESLLAHSDKLPGFKASPSFLYKCVNLIIWIQSFLSSLHGFKDALLQFAGNPHMKDIRGLLGMNVVTTTVPEPSCFIVALHSSTLSLYDFQKLCSVLCTYRFFEIISLCAQCISRIPISSPTAIMFLPGPLSTKNELEVSVWLINGAIPYS